MSDLIEQLGGYEKAKNIYDKAPPQSDNYADGLYYEQWQSKSWVRFDGEQCTDCKKPETPIHLYSLYLALLEYRRHHNIFEEGDWVVIPSRGNELFQVSRLLSRSEMQEMIHATPEEIKADKRLGLIDR